MCYLIGWPQQVLCIGNGLRCVKWLARKGLNKNLKLQSHGFPTTKCERTGHLAARPPLLLACLLDDFSVKPGLRVYLKAGKWTRWPSKQRSSLKHPTPKEGIFQTFLYEVPREGQNNERDQQAESEAAHSSLHLTFDVKILYEFCILFHINKNLYLFQ